MLEILSINAFSDNYIWVIKNTETKQCAVVDPGDAEPILHWLRINKTYQLSTILVTHHHKDHIGGIPKLVKHTSAQVLASNNQNIPNITVLLSDKQTIRLLGLDVVVMAVPGHTLDHIAYYLPKQIPIDEPWLFSGDTLFSAGCGRVLEGTMHQMHQSLERLGQLPAETKVFAAHEYTINNLLFALTIEPDNKIIKDYLMYCQTLRHKKIATLPSTLAIERKINPFLRCDQIDIINSAQLYIQKELTSKEDVFGVIREWKNNQS